MACDAAAQQVWANGIGLNVCIAQAYCNANGSLPTDVPTLDTWGHATGYLDLSGKWSCTPSPNPGTGQAPAGGAAPPASGGLGGILTWFQQNQVLGAGIIGAVALVLVVKR